MAFSHDSTPRADTGAEGGREGAFANTHWSLVLAAAQASSPKGGAALETLCRTYWYPLYFYVRRLGHSADDAQDLVQGFFARLLEKNYLQDADPAKGKFRSFLLIAFKRFMADEWVRANRQKRGGSYQIVSIEEGDTEVRYRAEPADQVSPEKAYEKRWALLLLENVLGRLESEFLASGRQAVFEALKIFLTGDKAEATYAEIAQRLGLSESNVKVLVHRLRARYREVLREQIAQTVDGTDEVDEEIRYLFSTMS